MSKSVKLNFTQLNNGYLVKQTESDKGTSFRDVDSLIENVLLGTKGFTKMLLKAMKNESTLVLTVEKESKLPKVKSKKEKKDKPKRPFLHPESEIAKRMANKDNWKAVPNDKSDEFDHEKISGTDGIEVIDKGSVKMGLMPENEILKGDELDELNQARKDVVLPADKFDPKAKVHIDPTIDFENNRITVNKENCFTNEQLMKMDLSKIFRTSGKNWSEWTKITGATKYFFTNLIISEEKNGKPRFYHLRTRVILTIGIKYLELLRAKNISEAEVSVDSEIPVK